MCNACEYLCCASDKLEACGCDCEVEACWSEVCKFCGERALPFEPHECYAEPDEDDGMEDWPDAS